MAELAYMSATAGILILVLLILRRAAGYRFSRRFFVLFGMVVLLRLLIPFSVPVKVDRETSFFGRQQSQNQACVVSEGQGTGAAAPKGAETMPEPGVLMQDASGKPSPQFWLFLFWAAGGLACAVYFGAAYRREASVLKEALPLERQRQQEFLVLAGIPRRVKILVSDRIVTPVTFGVIRPRIILPKRAAYSDSFQMKYVMLHEYVHICRKDNLWKLLSLGAVCLHWFNPLVWVWRERFERDLETSCDEKVIQILGAEKRQEYAMALISLAEQKNGGLFFGSGFGKQAIQERIVAIMKYKKASMVSMGCAALILAASVTVFGKTTYVEQEYGTAVTDSFVRSLVKSPEFSQYEKYGLRLDEDGYLTYEGKYVSYFKDEKGDAVTRGTIETGRDAGDTVGLRTIRDAEGELKGFEVVELETVTDAGQVVVTEDAAEAGTEAVEDEAYGDYTVEQLAEASTEAVEDEANGDYTVEQSAEASAEAVEDEVYGDYTVEQSAEAGTEAVEDEAYVGDDAGETYAYSYYTDTEEQRGLTKAYQEYGVSYDEKTGAWSCNGRKIAVLYDEGHQVYTSDSGEVYIQVLRDEEDNIVKLREVTEQEMDELFREMQ